MTTLKIRFPKDKLRRREALAFYLCISPWLIGFLLFYVGPMVSSLYISLTRWNLLTDPVFIGFDNYVRMFTRDPLFWKSFRLTLLYTLGFIPLDLIGGLLLAMLLNQRVRARGVFRTIFYLPSVLTGVAYAVVWVWVLQPDVGLLNSGLAMLGIEGPRWLQSPQWALPALLLMSLWGLGRSMLIFLAGLQDISEEFYESAVIDGASGWMRFWHITLPLITPALFFNLLFDLILSFQAFTNAFVTTNGGPLDSTLFTVLYLYRKGFEHLEMGYASALAWFLVVVIFLSTVVVFLTFGRKVFYLGGSEARE
ncbi:MAG: sugar ABC transporter permease [Anaerolineaceae bacterium]|nr:sugar ABC transporter permease [Anaerolineaceae bacterium]